MVRYKEKGEQLRLEVMKILEMENSENTKLSTESSKESFNEN